MDNRRFQYAVLKTLSYADIFDYPMTFSEIWKYLISYEKVSKKTLRKFLQRDNSFLGKKGSYFFLPGTEENVEERKRRRVISKKKMEKAKRTAYILSFIPMIKLIGVSGSLSMDNSREDHDIDFFIVTSNNSLWITRFFMCVILLCLGTMRRKHSDKVTDKICPNMLITSQSMAVEHCNRNLFVAHEVAQLKVLVNKEHTYEKFLHCNAWITTFLPNAMSTDGVKKNMTQATFVQDAFSNVRSRGTLLLGMIDPLFFTLQFWYMRSVMRNETVTRSIAKFHPLDRGSMVLSLYQKKLFFYKHYLFASYASKKLLSKKSLERNKRLIPRSGFPPLPLSFSHGFLTTGY